MITDKEIQQKIDSRTKPVGSLGKLEGIAFKVAKIQQTLTPVLRNPAILVFAADHGIADEGVSPHPKEITWQMVMNFVRGGAGINVFARQHNIHLEIIDAGVDYDFPPGLGIIDAKLMRGTHNMLYRPAMVRTICLRAMDKGAEQVRRQFERGCNIIGFGEMGIGNTSPASLLSHKFAGVPLTECVGRGAGLDDEGVRRKYEVLKQISEKYQPSDAVDILATFGGLEIAMICGAILEAKRLNLLIIADGFITTSAFLAAHALQPDILDNTLFSHSSDEKGHARMLQYLNGDPILHLNLRLGEGTGVALAYPIIRSALTFLNEMASFEEAAVFDVDKNRKAK